MLMLMQVILVPILMPFNFFFNFTGYADSDASYPDADPDAS